MTTTDSTQTIEQENLPRLGRRPGRVKLRVLDGPDRGKESVIDRTQVRVGRSQSADVRIEHSSLSGLHFELRLRREGVELLDLASKNGTRLLGRRIFHSQVHTGDTILAGDCRIELIEIGDVDVELRGEAREDGLLGISPAMRETFATLEKVAPRDLHVLVSGETGTGKELFSRAIHRRSKRRNRPFVVLDCGALAPTLAESALFGHSRGAFTGADADRPGVFERANGGTLLIDEIGELPLELQVKLLRALDRQEIVRVGEGVPRRVDVRIIAATHRDLRVMVDEGTFREDLYFQGDRMATLMILDVYRVRHVEDLGEDIDVVARLEPLAGDASGDTRRASQIVERSVTNDREILRCVLGPHAGLILVEGDVEGPVELILNAPVCSDATQRGLGRQ